MKQQNSYEKAFSLWLEEHNICYKSVKQTNRLRLEGLTVKSFDYVVDCGENVYVVELKGRVFKGNSFEKLSGLQNWVTSDDVHSLSGWQSIEGVDGAVLVFAYLVQDYLADLNGYESIEFDGDLYVFIAIEIDQYRRYMKTRSPLWSTVCLAVRDFRLCARKVTEIFGLTP